jgi:dipeptidase D
VRSSISTEKEYLIEQLKSLTTALGGAVEIQGEYPAWEYRKDSPLRSLMVKIFTEQYGREPVIQALHAGVECGIFSSRLPGLDCVSYGPDMTDIHTTNESMDAASVKRTWEYTLAILKELK